MNTVHQLKLWPGFVAASPEDPSPRVAVIIHKIAGPNGAALRFEFAVMNAKLNAKLTYPKNQSVWGF